MAQIGHERQSLGAGAVRDRCKLGTANLTLALYARTMERRDGEPERLKALVEGGSLGTGALSAPTTPEREHVRNPTKVAD